MNVSRELLERAESSLGFDPQALRRELAARAPAIHAPATALQRRIAHALGEGPGGGGASDLAVDRLLYGGEQLNVSFLERGMIAADAVARLEVFDDESTLPGCGTGFMVSPRLLLTNHHVVPSAESAARSWADFRHEYDALGRPVQPLTFALDPATFFFTDPTLDVTVVAVSPETPDGKEAVAAFGWLPLLSARDMALPGEWLSLVHHPGGRPKQIALRGNLLVHAGDARLWYVAESTAGSSGAPVFNDAWQVVAVHSLGVPARDRDGEILTADGVAWSEQTDESDIVWRASIGTPAAAIVRRLTSACGSHPLVRQAIAAGDVDAADAVVVPLGSGPHRARALAVPPASGGNGWTAAGQPADGGGASRTGNGNAAAAATAATTGAAGSGEPSDAITITVPLRITVRPNESGRAPMLGVNLS